MENRTRCLVFMAQGGMIVQLKASGAYNWNYVESGPLAHFLFRKSNHGNPGAGEAL
jgi:hypothetical protein